MAHDLPVTTAPPAVGVRRLRGVNDAATSPVYHGVSYCDAVRRAGTGESLRVLPGSIEVCRWSPIALGLRPPEGTFEAGLSPRLPHPVTGLLLAPLDRFSGDPEIVIVRAPRDAMRALFEVTSTAALWDRHCGQIDLSALPRLLGSHSTRRERVIVAVNRALASLAPSPRWQALTHHLFRSHAITAGFDALISRTLADMSICRNSTVIPLLAARANASFFCTGAITWGLNDPTHLTSGWPLPIYHSLISNTQYPIPGSQRSTP